MTEDKELRQTLVEGIKLESEASEIDDERWERIREIGRGGMGRVDLVYDQSLQRFTAMKRLRPESIVVDAGQFLREARIAGRIEHPNIVTVHELGRDQNGHPFFTMKHVRGHNFAALTYDVSRALYDASRLYDLLDVFRKVCDALAFAHQCGVIHRDIKLDNVMVGTFGQVYLMDWGIAKVFDASSFAALAEGRFDDSLLFEEPPTIRQGTPHCMAPEQVRGQNDSLDQRVDVWALGIMLYEILTRSLPFDGEDNEAVLDRVIHQELVPPSQVNAASYVPAQLEKVVLKALQKDRSERFQSVAEFKEAIEQFLRGGQEFPIETFAQGEVIVRAGDEADCAYVIASGLCSVWSETSKGEVLLDYMRSGDVFGEAAVFSKGRRAATVKAEERTVVHRVSESFINQEIDGQKPWTAAFIRTLAERFRQKSMRLDRLLEPPGTRDLHRHMLMFASAFGRRDEETLVIPWSDISHECMVRFDVEEAFLVETVTAIQGVAFDESTNSLVLDASSDIQKALRRP